MSVRLRDVTLPDFGLPVGRPEIPALGGGVRTDDRPAAAGDAPEAAFTG